jgi:hypothetical protein
MEKIKLEKGDWNNLILSVMSLVHFLMILTKLLKEKFKGKELLKFLVDILNLTQQIKERHKRFIVIRLVHYLI